MLKLIAEHLQGKLLGLSIWEKVHCFVEQVSSPSLTAPHEYIAKGNYKALAYDKFNGMAYIRKTARVLMDPYEDTRNTRPCETAYNWTYPLRIVSIIKKTSLEDSVYVDDDLALRIIREISTGNGSLKTDLAAMTVKVKVSGYETGNRILISEEYPGKEAKDFPYQYSYMAIDLEVLVTSDITCIPNTCETYA
jgi:hypothetical protein